ncbi:cysteine proteinase [Periconia macrospinosa]|uniref:ubiquitinyl hydrolase 1 n=1 Tax=Periconia macrospinosa TaxID=97972 RepID=A0A2V1DZF2_9PLEO|nr:cysteine proteinase [Periconia macrospinosa]
MNGVSRFLSRRDKQPHEKRTSKHWRNKSRSTPPTVSSELYKVFTNEPNNASTTTTTTTTPKDKEVEKKVKMLLHRLQTNGIPGLGEEQAEHALRWCPDDLDKAYDLLVLVNESFEGELKDYNPSIIMQGAINRNMVTCYLDALLFAMFACLDSFEAMLYNDFNDEPRKKLAGVLRLWVNLLRTGWLIRTDLTKHLQESIAKCGWEDAALIHQQDASEAFTFITGALDLPLLTLKMDIFHTGREDKEDDHKFVNERILEVAIPEQEEGKVVTLEQCLEDYFNNRIEVKRHLQRQNTLPSSHTGKDPEKGQTIHIEALEVSGPDSPIVATPTALEAPPTLASPTRPLTGRRRGDSLFTERYTVSSKINFDEKEHLEEMLEKSSEGRPRSASLRKEVSMPAWQFFRLIPWYQTDNLPQTDAQVAAHFSSKRPVLGICLKRYMMTTTGAPKRLDTFIDIPLEIGLPQFISDEGVSEDGTILGNFKLVLQSVVCHRGVTVDSGHYIALVRSKKPPKPDRPGSAHSEEEAPDTWLRFDDLANPRSSEVDVVKALKEESPYLLFFQVQPIDEELASGGAPPSYAEAQASALQTEPSKETLVSEADGSPTTAQTGIEWESVKASDAVPSLTETTISETPGRSSMSSNREGSTVLEELDSRGRSGPSTPAEEKAGFLASSSRRNSRAWLSGGKNSRPGSQNGDNRLSVTISRLTGRTSKDKLLVTETRELGNDPVITINDMTGAQSNDTVQPSSSPPKKKKDSGTLGRSKSKKVSKEEKKLIKSKSLEPINGVAVKGKGKSKERPDRECRIM